MDQIFILTSVGKIHFLVIHSSCKLKLLIVFCYLTVLTILQKDLHFPISNLNSPIRKQRITEIIFKGRFKNKASKITLKTGEVKQSTIRSLIGIKSTAVIQLKLAVDWKKPNITISRNLTFEVFFEGFEPTIELFWTSYWLRFCWS